MTTPTPTDYANASEETRRVIDGLDYVLTYCVNLNADVHALSIAAAIDRLLVLDALIPASKPHPRELALSQDAKRGNFRHNRNNNDRDADGA